LSVNLHRNFGSAQVEILDRKPEPLGEIARRGGEGLCRRNAYDSVLAALRETPIGAAP